LLLALALANVGESCLPLNVGGLVKDTVADRVEIPELGALRGKVSESRGGRSFVSFSGVPYAEPPVRWHPPVLTQGWAQQTPELNCKEPRSICPQLDLINGAGTRGSEDCLFLNIHTPDVPAGNLPVLVFFHGGGMALGSSDLYRPDFLMDEDIILVTVNYRLNVLGFFNLGTDVLSGNQGVRDAQLALKWIQLYISNFGGDSSRVTISGQSGGSWLTNLLYVSPLSEGLFSGAILESGTSIGKTGHPYDSTQRSMEKALAFAERVNCTVDLTKLEECLMETPLDDIISYAFDLLDLSKFYYPAGTLDPHSSHGSVLPYGVEELLEFGLFQQVPLMIGTTSQEGIMFSGAQIKNTTLLEDFDENYETEGRMQIFPEQFTFTECEADVANKARDFFVNGTFTKNDIVPYLNMLTDARFGFGTYLYATFASERVPVYYYNFTYITNTSIEVITPGINGYGLGAEHGSELQYLYIVEEQGWDYSVWSEKEEYFSKSMCEIWANFVTYGTPTPSGEWRPYSSDSKEEIMLDTPLKMTINEDKLRRMEFWDGAISDYNKCILST